MTKPLHNLLAATTLGLTILVGCSSASAQEAPESPGDSGNASPPATPEQPQADEATVQLLERIEAASNELQTLTSRIRYTRNQGLTGDQQRRFGDFYYSAQTDDQPTRIAVRFNQLLVDGRVRSMETWYIFDGRWLLERDQEDMTATRREMVPEGAENNGVIDMGEGQLPIPLRIDASEVLATYRVTRMPDETLGEDGTQVHLQLLPLDAAQDDTPMDLWFDTEHYRLQKVTTMQDGDQVEMLFRNHVPNAEIAADIFSTALPEGDDWQTQEVPLD